MNTTNPTPKVTEDIVPFWNRLREISLYPLRGDALMTIGLLALGRLFTLLPLGWLINLAIWVGVYKYAFEVLRNSANGRTEPPVGSLNVDESMGRRAILLQIGFVVLNVLGFLLFGFVGGAIVSVVLAFGLPGAFMSLAMDENVLHALNPATWLQVMARLGWPYFVAAGLCLVINASMANAQALLLPFLPYMVALVVFYFLAHYAVVATFHLMGYLIYQYHDELGYEVEPQPQARRASDDPDQALLDQSAELVRAGKPEDAATLLREHLRERGGSDAVHTQYRKLLRVAGNNEELLRHGREYISALLAQDKDKRALDIVRECGEIDPAFAPAQAGDVTRLAHKAADWGLTQVAIRLLSGFHKRFPKSADIPKNYLLVAKLMHDKLGQDREAQALLQQLKGAYPQHELMPQIEERMALIQRTTLQPAQS
ncbi:MAG: hypothetical protein E6K53_14270 [Gammaproteobacteria bacterium]|nr:MAG: hypothetical protein E6K53_14270 [Gammaproteobacteria bacterium]